MKYLMQVASTIYILHPFINYFAFPKALINLKEGVRLQFEPINLLQMNCGTWHPY